MSVSQAQFSCTFSECDYKAIPSEVRKHMIRFHKAGDEIIAAFSARVKATKAREKGTDLYSCEVCGKKYTSKGAIQNHVRQQHKSSQPSFLPGSIDQPIDASASGLTVSHLQSSSTQPAATPTSSTTSIAEPEKKKFRVCTDDVIALEPESQILECKVVSNQRLVCTHEDCCSDSDVQVILSSRADMCRHYKNEHNTEHTIEVESFSTKKDYETWLATREEATKTSFITRESKIDGNRTLIYLRCKHEGKYESTGTLKYGHPSKKATGDGICTAFLKAVNVGEKYTVEACFTHANHETSAAELSLTLAQKERVAQMVSQGFTNNMIAKQTKKETSKDSRLHYLNSDDIRNLKNCLKLNVEQLDRDDLRSVELRVQQNDPEDGIRKYIPPSDSNGTDFLMVIITPQHIQSLKKFSHKVLIIDDTHNISQYSLKLTTLTVVDNLDKSEPGGFLISSSTTSKEVAVLFQCVKEVFPNFRPYYFMSDEANAFWNGYSEVFDNSSSQKVICRWHTFRSWKKNAKKHLKDNLLVSTLQNLSEVLREPRKDKVIHRVLSMFTALDNEGSVGSKEFATYFRRYYYDRMDEWSASSRFNIACHTSMYAEAFHSVLKRIRKLASACPRKGLNRKKHREFLSSSSQFQITKVNDETYNVSVVNGTKKNDYSVIDGFECFCDKMENCHCSHCGACAYQYWCECLTSLAGIACIHMHGVALFKGSNITSAHVSPTPDVAPVCIDDVDIVDSFPSQSIRSRSPAPSADLLSDIVQPENQNNYSVSEISESEEISHRMDQVHNMFNSIYGELRKKRRNNDMNFCAALEDLENALKPLLPQNARPGLTKRSDADRASKTARETMSTISLKKRTKSKRKEPASSSTTTLISKRHIGRCIICAEEHPPLPEDIDEEEYESRFTDWKRCSLCKQPAHFSCTLSNKKCKCSDNAVFELYPDDYMEEDDSDE